MVGFLTDPKVSPTHTHTHTVTYKNTHTYTDLSFEGIQGFPKVRGAAHTRALVLVTHLLYLTHTNIANLEHKYNRSKKHNNFFGVLKSARNLTKEK